MLDVRRLRVLREVAARGSFSAAADALSYTQSAVSQQIAALEREAGTKLVERSSRGVRPTDAGRALVAHADVILARLADAEAELEAIAGLRGGRLRMTTFHSAGATIAPRAVVAFRAAHPGVELSLVPAEWPDNMELVRAGEADIALTVTGPGDEGSREGIELHHLLDDPLNVLLPAAHPLAELDEVELTALADEDWIWGSSTSSCPDSRVIMQACRDAGFSPNVIFDSDDYLAIQGFVAGGFGVSMIPDMALVALREDVVVKPVSGPPPVRSIWAATLAGSFASPAREAMLETLRAVSADSAPKTGLRLVA